MVEQCSTEGLTVDAVAGRLSGVVDRGKAEGARSSYFALFLSQLVAAIARGLRSPGLFDRPDLIDDLVASAVERYLTAFKRWQQPSTDRPSLAWRLAFDASEAWRPTALQQIFVGLNAHLELDLAVAAGQILERQRQHASSTATDDPLEPLREDFDRLGRLYITAIPALIDHLADLSPGIELVRRFEGEGDEEVGDEFVYFSPTLAVADARQFAIDLTTDSSEGGSVADGEFSNGDTVEEKIAAHDRDVYSLGERIAYPGGRLGLATFWIRCREGDDVAKTLNHLERLPWDALDWPDSRQGDTSPSSLNRQAPSVEDSDSTAAEVRHGSTIEATSEPTTETTVPK